VAAARAAWRAEAAGIDPARLVFLDESGIDTRLVRTHARAPRGRRAHGQAPGGHWHRLTLIGALALDGVCAAMAVAAATTAAVFRAFVEQALVPAFVEQALVPAFVEQALVPAFVEQALVPAFAEQALVPAFVEQALVPALRGRPGAIVVMDNLAAHKAATVREALDRAGLGHRYLPAYSPDMNPIEQAWSKLKARLRSRAARSREALERALPGELGAITGQDARNWFRHAGYQPN